METSDDDSSSSIDEIEAERLGIKDEEDNNFEWC